jgi:hypothetical protein
VIMTPLIMLNKMKYMLMDAFVRIDVMINVFFGQQIVEIFGIMCS